MSRWLLCLIVGCVVSGSGCSRKMVMVEAVMEPAPVATSEPAPQPGIDLPPNPVRRTIDAPVSTFSIDVDTGSYTRARRMLRDGWLPDEVTVRTEEFLNYFDHDYTPPESIEPPFSVSVEVAPAPWNARRHLLLIGIKGYEVPDVNLPPANLVFLIDTSGSMDMPDKLPLLREAFRELVKSLRPQDRVSIVTYAGSAGLVLDAARGDQRGAILDALDRLSAGGSTDGGSGIELAYRIAREQLIQGGINRIILATDGDFNVGTVSVDALKAMVAAQRSSGVSLTTLGFGSAGYNDPVAEQLADVGNGNHAYIDDVLEAKKVLRRELGATLLTIARDVKIQVEFNPMLVSEYRLLGYENRVLANQDFANDRVDAGEIGAGHDVTALYELAFTGSGGDQLPPPSTASPAKSPVAPGVDEIARVRLRYKTPDAEASRPMEHAVVKADIAARASPRLSFAAAIAGFAERLRGNEALKEFSYAELAALARDVDLPDPHAERAELADLIDLASTMEARRH